MCRTQLISRRPTTTTPASCNVTAVRQSARIATTTVINANQMRKFRCRRSGWEGVLNTGSHGQIHLNESRSPLKSKKPPLPSSTIYRARPSLPINDAARVSRGQKWPGQTKSQLRSRNYMRGKLDWEGVEERPSRENFWPRPRASSSPSSIHRLCRPAMRSVFRGRPVRKTVRSTAAFGWTSGPNIIASEWSDSR